MTETTAGTLAARRTPDVYFDDEVGVFVVASYDGADQVLRGHGWSSDIRHNVALVARFGGSEFVPSVLSAMMLFMDPPGHTRMRRLVAPAFTARRIEAFRPRVAVIVEAALAGLEGVREFDVLGDLAYPIPVAVIAELLDVGTEGAQLIRAETPKLTGLVEIDPTEQQLLDAADGSMACTMFLLPLLAERRKNPGDDFISALLAVDADGERLSLEEVLATVLLLLIAGHETTANLIANGTLNLLSHPDQLRRLQREPELITPAVEEILRLDPPARIVGRTATVDHVIGGQEIQAGQQVLVHLTAANRDPARFAEPDRFDITRTGTSHLAFGAGPHFCIGWALARTETEETLRRLFTRFPDLALLHTQPRWRRSTTFHALEQLPVRSA